MYHVCPIPILEMMPHSQPALVFLCLKIQAEAELIQAIVLLFERLGITSSDVGIRLSSRKVSAHYLLLYILASIFCFCD
jgi:hypothetical protein